MKLQFSRKIFTCLKVPEMGELVLVEEVTTEATESTENMKGWFTKMYVEIRF